jgi:hypothetical protein
LTIAEVWLHKGVGCQRTRKVHQMAGMFEGSGGAVRRFRFRACVALGGGAAAAVLALLGSASATAASLPNVTGQKYSDASSAINSAGFTPVVSTAVGDRKAWSDCIVTNVVQRTKQPPANTQGSAVNQVLVSLNCDAGVASASKPGYSAGSPEGRAAIASAASATPAPRG